MAPPLLPAATANQSALPCRQTRQEKLRRCAAPETLRTVLVRQRACATRAAANPDGDPSTATNGQSQRRAAATGYERLHTAANLRKPRPLIKPPPDETPAPDLLR